jgi:molecular chaperone GrpE (heat shock protein)
MTDSRLYDKGVIKTLCDIFKNNRKFHELIDDLIRTVDILSHDANIQISVEKNSTVPMVLETSKVAMKLAADKICLQKEQIKSLEKKPHPPKDKTDISATEETAKSQEELIEKLRDENEKLRLENQNLKDDKQNIELEMINSIARNNELKSDIDAEKDKINVLSEQTEKLKKELEKVPSGSLKHYNELIDRMIEFRDQLLYFRDEYAKAEDKAVAEATVKLLEMLFKETGRFMKLCGAEIIDEKGKFNSAYQYIVGTVKTDDPELDETIESTFQPGYIIDGIPKRPQRVMIYAYN